MVVVDGGGRSRKKMSSGEISRPFVSSCDNETEISNFAMFIIYFIKISSAKVSLAIGGDETDRERDRHDHHCIFTSSGKVTSGN